ncbi:hypothetical protein JK145_01540 [Sodalis sp. CWE]|nr:hypothetical protein [Sodalis sp. CWE]
MKTVTKRSVEYVFFIPLQEYSTSRSIKDNFPADNSALRKICSMKYITCLGLVYTISKLCLI